MSSTKGRVIACKAAVCWSPNRQTIETIQVSPPQAGEVRIRVTASGICGSDNHILKADAIPASELMFPIILGHEPAGIVESTGAGVTAVSEGDLVVVVYMPQCEECEWCREPDTNYCQRCTPDGIAENKVTMADGSFRLSTSDGQPIYKFLNAGAFAEYVVVGQEQVVKIPASVDPVKACLFACGIGTGYGTTFNIRPEIRPSHVVAIWGLGTVGLSAILGARDMQAREIIGVDVNESKFELAVKFGCTRVINPRRLAGKTLDQLFQEDYGGLNLAVDCVGSVPIMETMLKSINAWGKVCLVGIPPPGALAIDPIHMIRGRFVIGACFGGFKGKDAIRHLLGKYLAGELPVDDFISDTISLDQLNDGLDRLSRGEVVKIVVKM